MDSCKTSFDVLEFYTIYEYVYGIRLLQNNMDITNKQMKYQVHHQQIHEVTWFILNEVLLSARHGTYCQSAWNVQQQDNKTLRSSSFHGFPMVFPWFSHGFPPLF